MGVGARNNFLAKMNFFVAKRRCQKEAVFICIYQELNQPYCNGYCYNCPLYITASVSVGGSHISNIMATMTGMHVGKTQQ